MLKLNNDILSKISEQNQVQFYRFVDKKFRITAFQDVRVQSL